MLHHDCDVRNDGWYSNKGYFIQCGIITIPKTEKENTSNCDTFIDKFSAIDADTLIKYTGKAELGYIVTRLIPKAGIEANYTFLAVFSRARYRHASIGYNDNPTEKAFGNTDYYYDNHMDDRYVLDTNDSITVSITRKKTANMDNIENEGKRTDDDKGQQKHKYMYTVSYMKNCDKSQIFLDKESVSDNIPYVMELDCEKNDYLIGMTSVACSCNTRGFEYQVNVC